MKYLLVLPLILVLTGCPFGAALNPEIVRDVEVLAEDALGVQEQAEFYKCAPVGGEDVIVACAVGTSLTGCEHIGSGMTDKQIIDCQ
jgi:hypothetical protein